MTKSIDIIMATDEVIRACLELIPDIAVDYDGYNTAKNIKELIDEMADHTREAKRLLDEIN